jgi:hypothetical protein
VDELGGVGVLGELDVDQVVEGIVEVAVGGATVGRLEDRGAGGDRLRRSPKR